MTTPLEQALAHAADALRPLVPFALVGGLAVATRAEPRLTRDGDLAVAVDDDAHAERIIAELNALGYRLVSLVEQTSTERLATARLVSPVSDHILIDLLVASSGIEPEVVRDATDEWVTPRLRLPVASVGHLIAMKLLSADDEQRRQDQIDLLNLADVAVGHDWATAAEAVELIEARRYNRGRDLAAALAELRENRHV